MLKNLPELWMFSQCSLQDDTNFSANKNVSRQQKRLKWIRIALLDFCKCSKKLDKKCGTLSAWMAAIRGTNKVILCGNQHHKYTYIFIFKMVAGRFPPPATSLLFAPMSHFGRHSWFGSNKISFFCICLLRPWKNQCDLFKKEKFTKMDSRDEKPSIIFNPYRWAPLWQ